MVPHGAGPTSPRPQNNPQVPQLFSGTSPLYQASTASSASICPELAYSAHQVDKNFSSLDARQIPRSPTVSDFSDLSYISDADILSNFALYDALQGHAHMVATIWPQPAQVLLDSCPTFAKLYSTIKDTNIPNYLGARIPVSSGLNILQWRLALVNYHDQDLCDLLEFG